MHNGFILASTSTYRKALLEKLKLSFKSVAPNVDETALAGESATALVKRLAKLKATDVADDFPDQWVIGSDQVASLNQHILTKPLTFENAVAQLSLCSGNTVTFWTGLALVNRNRQTESVVVESFDVHFRKLSHHQIERYVELEQPLDCAGSFKSEGLGICLFERFSGRDPNCLIGLPLMLLCDLLAAEGIQLPL